MKSRIGRRFLILIVVVLLLSGCDVIAPSSTIDDIVLLTALDADYCPVDFSKERGPRDLYENEVTTFEADGPIYCSVIVSNLRSGSMVSSRWYFGEQFVEEIHYQVQAGGSGCVGFELTSPNSWPGGGYRVEVYLDGQLERTATFAVR